MINGLFDVAIDTPKYHRRATLDLVSEGASIAAVLTISEHDPLYFEGTCADKEFDFEGDADLPGIGPGGYKAHGSVWGNSVTLTCDTVAGKVEVFGTRLSASTGGVKSSHEYMMSASTGDVAADDGTMYSGLYADGG